MFGESRKNVITFQKGVDIISVTLHLRGDKNFTRPMFKRKKLVSLNKGRIMPVTEGDIFHFRDIFAPPEGPKDKETKMGTGVRLKRADNRINHGGQFQSKYTCTLSALL